MRWNPTDAFNHPGEHKEILYCEDDPQCLWVVEQHQPIKVPEVPEFTISVKWQDGDMDKYLDGKTSYAHGWRYVMRWTDQDGLHHITGYGFPTEDAARRAAEAKATKIVRAQQPEKVYKFTPEV